MGELVSLEERLEQVMRAVRPLRSSDVPMEQARGLVLRDPVIAPADVPAYDVAEVDGYAVRLADLTGATREEPRVLGMAAIAIPDGREPAPLPAGMVMGVQAGGPLPEGTEAVLPLAESDRHPRQPALWRVPEAGEGISRAGSWAKQGQVLLEGGTVLAPQHLLVLGTVGLATVRVAPRPRVAVVIVGDGLVPPGTTPAYGQRPDGLGALLAGLVVQRGATVARVSRVLGASYAVRGALGRALGEADLVVVAGGTGGFGTGTRDELENLGVEFPEVAVAPEGVYGFGVVQGVPVVAVPGSAAGVFAGFEAYVRPVLAALADRTSEPDVLQAVVQQGWDSPEGLTQYQPVRVTGDASDLVGVVPVAGHGDLDGVVPVDTMAIVGPATTRVETGSVVTIVRPPHWL